MNLPQQDRLSLKNRPSWGAVFVLYCPDVAAVLQNLQQVRALGGEVLLVDNSPEPIDLHWGEDPLISTLYNGNRGGIAGALNRGAEWASQCGFEWLLTMDQDSSVEEEWLLPLYQASLSIAPLCAILTPLHDMGVIPRSSFSAEEKVVASHTVLTAMSSGNLLRLSAWRAVDGFDERYFIDQVDHDFCLRLKDAGYQIFEFPSLRMVHPLGAITFHRLLWRRRKPVSHHSPLRRYTMTRNRFFALVRHSWRHPRFLIRELSHLADEWLCLLLFEKHRRLKLVMIALGCRDFLLRRWGAPSAAIVARASRSKE